MRLTPPGCARPGPAEQHLQLQRLPPYAVTSWAPDINGTINSIVFSGSNCANAYIGGEFTIALAGSATPAKNIGEISTTQRKVIQTFAHNASQVDTLVGYQGHIIAGGIPGDPGLGPAHVSPGTVPRAALGAAAGTATL